MDNCSGNHFQALVTNLLSRLVIRFFEIRVKRTFTYSEACHLAYHISCPILPRMFQIIRWLRRVPAPPDLSRKRNSGLTSASEVLDHNKITLIIGKVYLTITVSSRQQTPSKMISATPSKNIFASPQLYRNRFRPSLS